MSGLQILGARAGGLGAARASLDPTRALAFARRNLRRFVGELAELVRIPSVSAQPQHAPDMRRCAGWLAAELRRIGLHRVAVHPTAGHPIVYGEWLRAPGRPTLLVYGHYDVVPAEPLSEWTTPPFEPTLRGLDLHGRGACDDKGQLYCHVKALEAWLRTHGALPVNVKCLFEGEEETGSPRLAAFVERNRRALAADVAVMSDTRFLGPGRPAIVYGLRGKLVLELAVRAAGHDLHCGNYGGTVHNPLQALAEMLARLHDPRGRITVPGFYDRVRGSGAVERAFMRRTGPTDAEMLHDAGAPRPWGEAGFSQYERATVRPALSINGITGGYQGEGAKAVLPAAAVAKLDFRLVPDQDPREIEQAFRRHVARLTPPTVTSSVRVLSASRPALLAREYAAMRIAANAYRRSFGAAPAFVRSGGTIPVVDTFRRVLGVPTVLMGFALPDAGIHAANEKVHLPQLARGIDTCIWFMAGLPDLQLPEPERE